MSRAQLCEFTHIRFFVTMKHTLCILTLSALTLAACSKKEDTAASAPTAAAAPAANTEEKVLNVYNWPDYIAKDMLANFEKDTGIKVNYQTFGAGRGICPRPN
jgi:putrescine transport system substrate-binding protein